MDNEHSSKRLATVASQVLRDPTADALAKSLAGSVLSQAEDHNVEPVEFLYDEGTSVCQDGDTAVLSVQVPVLMPDGRVGYVTRDNQDATYSFFFEDELVIAP